MTDPFLALDDCGARVRRTLGDVTLADLASPEARRARSMVLGAECGMAGQALDEFASRMERSWRRQMLADEQALTELERAQDDSRRGMLRRADALVAECLDQPLERAER